MDRCLEKQRIATRTGRDFMQIILQPPASSGLPPALPALKPVRHRPASTWQSGWVQIVEPRVQSSIAIYSEDCVLSTGHSANTTFTVHPAYLPISYPILHKFPTRPSLNPRGHYLLSLLSLALGVHHIATGLAIGGH